MKHYNIKVTGKVQGVFFRASTQNKAKELGICGWVRNEPDGSVYIEAEGEPHQLEALVSWCKTGPAGADVKDVNFDSSHELKGFGKFEVRRH